MRCLCAQVTWRLGGLGDHEHLAWRGAEFAQARRNFRARTHARRSPNYHEGDAAGAGAVGGGSGGSCGRFAPQRLRWPWPGQSGNPRLRAAQRALGGRELERGRLERGRLERCCAGWHGRRRSRWRSWRRSVGGCGRRWARLQVRRRRGTAQRSRREGLRQRLSAVYTHIRLGLAGGRGRFADAGALRSRLSIHAPCAGCARADGRPDQEAGEPVPVHLGGTGG